MPEVISVPLATYEAYLSQYGIPVGKDFYGTSYTLSKVDYLLNKPIRVGNLMGQRDEFHFNLTLIGKRTPIGLQPSFQLYKGAWYRQGPEPTCLPWAIANGLLSRRVRPDSLMMYRLLSEANRRNGLDYIAAWLMVDLNAKFFSFDKAKVELVPNLVLLNSSVIKQEIDQHRTILTGVESSSYEGRILDLSGEPIRDNHAVCIVGYEVNEDGVMNVQLIDSNLGIFWTSLEYLSASLKPNETYLVSAKL